MRHLPLSDLRDLFGDLTLAEALARRGYIRNPFGGGTGRMRYRDGRSLYVRSMSEVRCWQYLARVELKLAALLGVPSCETCGFPVTERLSRDLDGEPNASDDLCKPCNYRHISAVEQDVREAAS